MTRLGSSRGPGSGFHVRRVIGEVFGLTVRSRHLGSQIGAGLTSMVGGELKGLTKTLVETRNQAMERLVEQARSRGAAAAPKDGGRGRGKPPAPAHACRCAFARIASRRYAA